VTCSRCVPRRTSKPSRTKSISAAFRTAPAVARALWMLPTIRCRCSTITSSLRRQKVVAPRSRRFPVATHSAKSATSPTSPRRWLVVSRFRPAIFSLVMTSSLLPTTMASWPRRWFRSSSSTSIACVFRTFSPGLRQEVQGLLGPLRRLDRRRSVRASVPSAAELHQVSPDRTRPPADAGLRSGSAGIKGLCRALQVYALPRSPEDELLENEKLWMEENAAKLKKKTGASPPRVSRKATSVRSACVLPVAAATFDFADFDDEAAAAEGGDRAVKVATWAATWPVARHGGGGMGRRSGPAS
jgi:hypothetical protein